MKRPARRKLLSVPLPLELHAAIFMLAEVRGKTASALVRDILVNFRERVELRAIYPQLAKEMEPAE